MAVQKSRKSPSKRGMHRSHDHLSGPALSVDRTSGENATAFKFEVTSKELLGKLETVGDNVAAKVLVDVNGKPYVYALTRFFWEP